MSSVLLVVAAARCILPAQTVRPDMRFEVASVRLNRTAACRGRWDFNASHGMINAENAPLLRIISRAYELTDDRIAGPVWLESTCYDIIAKASAGTADGDLMPMLRTLLKERFHLSARVSSEERPVSVLLLDKGGSKLRPYGADVPVPSPIPDGYVLFMVRHLQDLCEKLGKVTGRPAIDRTGLNGDYMIVLTYRPFAAISNDPSIAGSDIISAMRDQLGLRLESQRAAVDVLKVDRVDKVPTEN